MKLESPASERNREPIRKVLTEVLPESGTVLEVASGSGQHAVYLGAAFPKLRWQPSDIDPDARASVSAWVAEAMVANVAMPVELDTTAASWPLERADAIVCVNMIHISPWAACVGLFAGAERLLDPGAPLILYGPFVIDGQTAPSNRAFGAALARRDSSWGVRELRDVERVANERGFVLERIFDMPANNKVVVFRRVAGRDM